MDTFLAIKAFLETVDAGSFSNAARRLGLAPSVVMKRVNHLEHMSRKQLLHRTTREVRLTEAGKRELAALRRIGGDVDQVLANLRRPDEGMVGRLRVGAPPALTSLVFGALISRFAREHPRIAIEITLIDHPISPIDHALDVVIGAFSNTFANVRDIPLFPLRRVICGSPEYLARMGTPREPRHLFSHKLLALAPAGGQWEFTSVDGPVRIEVLSDFVSNDSQVLAAAAVESIGLAMLPSYVAQPAIRRGELVEVLAAFPVAEVWFKAFLGLQSEKEPAIHALLAWITKELPSK